MNNSLNNSNHHLHNSQQLLRAMTFFNENFQLRLRKTYSTFNLVKFLKIPDDISRILLRLRNLHSREDKQIQLSSLDHKRVENSKVLTDIASCKSPESLHRRCELNDY